MRIYLLLVLFSAPVLSFAQTKKIAHRSHSGTNHTFSLHSIDNLGRAPIKRIREASLDTLKYLPDNRIVMVTSEVCLTEQIRNRRIYDTSVWKAGADTMTSHPLFSEQHSLDSIKTVLKNTYNFQNDIDEVQFIGYDNEKPKSKKIKADKKKRKKKEKSPKKEHSSQQSIESNHKIDGGDSRVNHSMLWFLLAIPFVSLGFFAQKTED